MRALVIHFQFPFIFLDQVMMLLLERLDLVLQLDLGRHQLLHFLLLFFPEQFELVILLLQLTVILLIVILKDQT